MNNCGFHNNYSQYVFDCLCIMSFWLHWLLLHKHTESNEKLFDTFFNANNCPRCNKVTVSSIELSSLVSYS